MSTVTGDPFANGALSVGFVDLYGATAFEAGVEEYPTPASIVGYYIGNSKAKVKTLIDPTADALDNLTDYVATSIKSLTTTTILASVANPRNSTYVSA